MAETLARRHDLAGPDIADDAPSHPARNLDTANHPAIGAAQGDRHALIVLARLLGGRVQELSRSISRHFDRTGTRHAIDMDGEHTEENGKPGQWLHAKAKLDWRYGLGDQLHQAIGGCDQQAIFLRHTSRRVAKEIDRPQGQNHHWPEKPGKAGQRGKERYRGEDGDEAPAVL